MPSWPSVRRPSGSVSTSPITRTVSARNAEGPGVASRAFALLEVGSGRSDRFYVLRLETLRPLRHVEGHLLAFGQCAEPFGGDRRVMAEDVLATVVLSDEAKALRIVDPLHSASRHLLSR